MAVSGPFGRLSDYNNAAILRAARESGMLRSPKKVHVQGS
jgi:hypothetical protein